MIEDDLEKIYSILQSIDESLRVLVSIQGKVKDE